jgi:hypothetical protein
MKRAVEECLSWDINDLLRAGVFKAAAFTPCDCVWRDASRKEILRVNFRWEDNAGTSSLRIFERQDAASPRDLTVELALVSCHLGGMKHVFLCPGGGHSRPCGRRVQKLYLIDGKWRCRECGNLTYLARRQHDKRKDALLRDPAALIAALDSNDRRRVFVALGAYAQAMTRLRKYGDHLA